MAMQQPNKMEREGRIVKLTGGNYYTKVADKILKCRARGRFRHDNIKPVVGDRVLVEILNHDEGYILDVKARQNILVRPPIANINQALIITSYREPVYSFNLINKLLAIVEFHDIKPIIIVTKIDLGKSLTQVKTEFNDYLNSGYQVFFTSAENKVGLEEVSACFKDNLSVLIGQSGAGKSSLLNALDASFNIETNEISKALNRGKHTTRHVEIYETKHGLIADSPGFSSLSLDELDMEDLAVSYHDFREGTKLCKFANCLHNHEPGCHIKELVCENKIPQSRYDDYLLFLDEISKRKVRY